MSYSTITYKTSDIPKNVIFDINSLLKEIVDTKKDFLWENYKSYDFEKNLYISVQYNKKGNLELLSSIFTRDFYPKNTFRIFNKLVRSIHNREKATKTNKGSHPSHEMLHQQIEIVKELNSNFYFISRQKETNRWMNFYIHNFNKNYNNDLIVTNERYWVCPNFKDEFSCAQILIHPQSKMIPFEKLTKKD